MFQENYRKLVSMIICLLVFFSNLVIAQQPNQVTLSAVEKTKFLDNYVLIYSENYPVNNSHFSRMTSPLDSPYVGSVNGWEYWDDSFFSQGIFIEVGSYFSDKYNQSGQTFYHIGESVPGITSDSLFLMNTQFKKSVEEFTFPREFWIQTNLDFLEGDAFPWIDFNIWYEDGPHNFFGLFMLGIGYGMPWDSVDTPNTFVLKMPDSYYQTSIDSGWVFHGLNINIMSSLVTAQPYTQKLGFWFSGIEAVYYNDNQQDTAIVVLDDFLVSSLVESEEHPKSYRLLQNYPNPFNPSTKMNYSVPENCFVTLRIFDVLGREISTLVNEKKSPGTYEVYFNASNLSSGIYFYQIRTKNYTQTKKMLLLR